MIENTFDDFHYDILDSDPSGYRLRFTDFDGLQQAWLMVHDAYHKAGIIAPEKDRMYYSLRHADPKSVTAFVMYNKKALATSTVFFDSPLGLPSDELFKLELDMMRNNGSILAEASCLATDTDESANKKTILKILFRFTLLSAWERECTELICMTHPAHSKFYIHTFGFETLSDIKYSTKLNNAPAILLTLTGKRVLQGLKGMLGSRIKENHEYIHKKDYAHKLLDYMSNHRRLLSWQKFLYWFDVKRPYYSRATSDQKLYLSTMLRPLIANHNSLCINPLHDLWSPNSYSDDIKFASVG